ncbi:MAG: oxidoreductase [Alphaproteobacteria bacterium]|nr:oxidoreductase [Alphaproteobacteria bacterium]
MTIPTLQVRVRQVTWEAEDISSFEFVSPKGDELPSFSAGSHVDVHLPGGMVRQYSLCNPPTERHRYVVAVLNEKSGRGGSRSMHQNVRPGDLITISAPRNNFPLHPEAGRHLLIAGGIGITPLLAMVHQLNAIGANYELYYCTRTPEKTAFRDALARIAGTRVHLHHDGGDPSRGLDLKALLWTHEMGTHVYCCGPTGLMSAVKTAAAHWPQSNVHYEYFAPLAAPAGTAPASVDDTFEVRLAKSGKTFTVTPDKSILQALRDAGGDQDSSCESGTCGTCATVYLEGEPDHRDYVLGDDEHKKFIMVCVSRCKSPVLVLDL